MGEDMRDVLAWAIAQQDRPGPDQHQQFVTTLFGVVQLQPDQRMSQGQAEAFQKLELTVTEDVFVRSQVNSNDSTSQILYQEKNGDDSLSGRSRSLLVQSSEALKDPSPLGEIARGHRVHGLGGPFPILGESAETTRTKEELILSSAGLLELRSRDQRLSLIAKVLIQLLALRLRIVIHGEDTDIRDKYLTLINSASFYMTMSTGIYSMAYQMIEVDEFSVHVPPAACKALSSLLFPEEAPGGGRFLYAMHTQAAQELEKSLDGLLQHPERVGALGAMWTPLFKLWDAAIGGLLQTALDFIPLERELIQGDQATEARLREYLSLEE